MELVYNYLIGQEFYNRVSGIAEAFVTLRQDLETEKRAYQKYWAKREKQLERVLINTSGLHGDLQAIIGSTLPEIKGMSLTALETDGFPDGSALPDGEGAENCASCGAACAGRISWRIWRGRTRGAACGRPRRPRSGRTASRTRMDGPTRTAMGTIATWPPAGVRFYWTSRGRASLPTSG
jgi:hypothetical protein